MTTFGDMLYQLGGVPVLGNIPFSGKSKVYFVNPSDAAASDGNDGLTPLKPLATVQAAEDKCVSGRHDTVVLIGGATASAIAAAITWDKSYTHLIGVGCLLPGLGQRCRVTGSSTVAATTLLNITGAGCIFANLQLFNGANADAESQAAVVAGDRNYFKNVFFAGMGGTTSAAHVGGSSLEVSGGENFFEDCAIGLDTVVRAAANYQLIVSGERNAFRKTQVRSSCVTAGAFMVKVDNTADDLRSTFFDECLFYNHRENWGTAITDCFDMPASGNTPDVLLHNCMMYGCTGWGDTVTHLLHDTAAPATGGGIAIAVNA
jgi:hypothetical protein